MTAWLDKVAASPAAGMRCLETMNKLRADNIGFVHQTSADCRQINAKVADETNPALRNPEKHFFE